MTNPRWLLFLAAAFAGGMAMAATNNYLFPYLKGLGAVETTMGFALTLATVCEVPVLFFGNRLLRWLDPNQLFLVALGITSGRMLLLAAAGTVNQVLLIQLLSGLTFPAMWLAGVACADEDAPPGLSATLQGLFDAVYGVGSAVGGFLGGALLAAIGARAMYSVFGLTVLVLGARWLSSRGAKTYLSNQRDGSDSNRRLPHSLSHAHVSCRSCGSTMAASS